MDCLRKEPSLLRIKARRATFTMPKEKNPPEKAHPDAWIERLKEAGFTVQTQEGSRARVSKHGCAAVIEQSSSGEPQFGVRPGLEIGQTIAHLVDRGFQKFWQDGDRRLPALATQLQGLHQFEQDLRAAMGLTALYNEALGTVSSRYIYDRLEGRENPKRHQPF